MIWPKPFFIETPTGYLVADIEAHRPAEIAIQEIIVVEVKCFPDGSADTVQLYIAIGQYLVYRELIDQSSNPKPLYLAIPTTAYYGIFGMMGMAVVKKYRIKLIVVNLDTEEIEQWLE